MVQIISPCSHFIRLSQSVSLLDEETLMLSDYDNERRRRLVWRRKTKSYHWTPLQLLDKAFSAFYFT